MNCRRLLKRYFSSCLVFPRFDHMYAMSFEAIFKILTMTNSPKDDLVTQVVAKYGLEKSQAQRDVDALMKGRQI
jgi:hypothetical protein